jgi:peptide/nickel transport system substrate-binding protein
MGAPSSMSNLVQFIILIIIVFGVYFVVDSNDLARKSFDESRKSYEETTKELRRIRKTLKSIRHPNDISDNTVSTTNKKSIRFNNSDLMYPDADEGGSRTTVVSSFSGNLNYIINNEATVGSLWNLCNDKLGARNAKRPNKFEPRMASSWEVSADGKAILINLKRGIFWHDFTDPITGKKYENVPVTANDFKFYIDTIRNQAIPCDPIRSYYKDLDRIEVINDNSFRVIWKKTYFQSLAFTLGMSPLPRHFYRPDSKTTDKQYAEDLIKDKALRNQIIVGCGPYIFKKYIKGDRIILERNDNYFGPLPSIRQRIIRQIKHPEKQLIEFNKGTTDAHALTSPQWFKQSTAPDYLLVCNNVEDAVNITTKHDKAKNIATKSGTSFGKHKFEKYLYRSFSYNFICWNMRKQIFSDKLVRQALTQGINREHIIKEVFMGLGTPTTGNFVPHSLYYDKSIKPWSFDPAKAKIKLKKAGWNDSDNDGILDKDLNNDGKPEPFTFTFLMISKHPYQSKWVPLVQQNLSDIGIDMKVTSAEWSVYTEKLNEFSFDACSFYWSGGIESDPYQLWHGSQVNKKGSSNVAGFKNLQADKLIEIGRQTLDQEKRIKIFKQFHRIIHEEQPYTFIFNPYAKVAIPKRFHNLIVYPTGMVSDLHWIPKSMQRNQ